jgi:hypothetical protein
MKIINKIPYLIVAVSIWLAFASSCANQGMPTGGPRDTIPPIIVSTRPDFKALNYKEDEVNITFNEFIIPDEISEKLVVSPPLKKRPTILTKSKTLIIRFNEELLDSTTYSLDFKNSVVDNNEKNPYENLRFSFSTGNTYDSLRVAGKIINAFNLEPVENTLVMLHNNLHDSTVYSKRPDYIAKTNEKGIFLIDNIKKDEYHIFSVNDVNNDLLYNEGAEKIAFYDSVIGAYAEFHEELDTLSKGVDSILIAGHTHFYPGSIYLRQFTEDIFTQYLSTSRRDTRYKCTFAFNEPVKDSFDIKLLNKETSDWYLIEPDQEYDSLTVWLADTTIANMDTLLMELSYLQLDSTNILYLHKDTLELNFSDKKDDPKQKRKSRKEDNEGPPPVPQFEWITNLSSSSFDLNKDIILTSPQPLKNIDDSGILVFLTKDTLKTPIDFDFVKDTAMHRTYHISVQWEPEMLYTLEIDSAACENIYGITSKKLTKNFETQEEDYYGEININITGVKTPVIVQLLENTDEENVVNRKTITNNKKIVFDYLAPDKYKVKVIYDNNENGKWDTGSYQDKYQPERVAYINEVIKVRSNWVNNINWDLKPDPTFTKDIRDKELEERKRKEAEEKAREKREQRQGPVQQENNMFRPGGFGPESM